jgi:hypothetical protein
MAENQFHPLADDASLSVFLRTLLDDARRFLSECVQAPACVAGRFVPLADLDNGSSVLGLVGVDRCLRGSLGRNRSPVARNLKL